MTVRNPRGVDTAPLPVTVTRLTRVVGTDLLTVGSDLQEQLAEHSRQTLMRHHGGKPMQWSETAALDFAQRFKPLAGCLHDVAYCVADQLYDDQWKTGDGARVRAAHLIAEHLGCGLSTAHNALQAAELGRRLTVRKVGTPNAQQLMTIVWAKVKGPQGRGWGQINSWMLSKGFTFENTSLQDARGPLPEDQGRRPGRGPRPRVPPHARRPVRPARCRGCRGGRR